MDERTRQELERMMRQVDDCRRRLESIAAQQERVMAKMVAAQERSERILNGIEAAWEQIFAFFREALARLSEKAAPPAETEKAPRRHGRRARGPCHG